jgi:hypothetical protein
MARRWRERGGPGDWRKEEQGKVGTEGEKRGRGDDGEGRRRGAEVYAAT